MRIIVNDIAASKTGALAILLDFYEYVRHSCSGDEWIFLTGVDCIKNPPPFITVKVMDHVKRSQTDRLKFDLLTGSAFLEELEPDVIFSLQNTLTRGAVRRRHDLILGGRLIARKGDRVPQVLYVHQPLSFQTTKRFSFLKKEEREYAVYQYLIGALIESSVRRSDLCIVQTGWMQEAVAKKTGVGRDRIAKVLPGVGDMSAYRLAFDGDTPADWDKNSFFFPSGEILYKNHECVIKAAAILNDRGYRDFRIHFTLKGLSDVTSRVYNDPYGNIVWSGRIDREEVLREYSRGTLVFPSYIETFGVPLAEARGAGTLVLASDCPFSRDVLDGYENAYYFDPFDPAALADLMEKVLKGSLMPHPSGTGAPAAGREDQGYDEIVSLIRSVAPG